MNDKIDTLWFISKIKGIVTKNTIKCISRDEIILLFNCRSLIKYEMIQIVKERMKLIELKQTGFKKQIINPMIPNLSKDSNSKYLKTHSKLKTNKILIDAYEKSSKNE